MINDDIFNQLKVLDKYDPAVNRGRNRNRADSGPTELSNRLASDAERTRLLTGEADPISSPVYPAPRERPIREDYDPIDRDFNRQFSEAPRGRQPWHSDSIYNPLERDPLSGYDFREGRYR